MHLMPMDLARRIYRTEYWDRLHLDEIDRLAPDVAYQVFDAAVNCGTGMAGGWLQRALNVLNRGGADYADLTVDGAVGAKTIAAVRAFLKARPAQGARVLLKAIRALQGVHYITLAERRPKDEAFVVGWLDHRI
jgi:lysozyme family protein